MDAQLIPAHTHRSIFHLFSIVIRLSYSHQLICWRCILFTHRTMKYPSLLLAMMLALATSVVADAGDYSNECKSSDGMYLIVDGVLEKQGDPPGATRPYRIIESQVLSETNGYCVPSNANGAKFNYSSRRWREKIVTDDIGPEPLTIEIACEMATSGLPAAFNCDRDTVTKTQTSPSPMQSWEVGAKGTWSHNGSAMKLETHGEKRQFIYMNPRSGLLAAGVRPNMALFEGVRQGNAYSGTARYWSIHCGVQTFVVTGTVSTDERLVTLSGDAPKLDPACTVTGRSFQTLLFDRH